ncbi:hypothetical protein ACHHV8_31800 [Paenibacillus sp. TAB 01]|uniref:hypothetical protein n=1 Tax=Paenibacillus sp. TAB 01 TaxID=3368988 RepID=UPI003751D6D8
MSKKQNQSIGRTRARRWARHAGSALAAIPLLLQPFAGASVSAAGTVYDSGGAAASNIIMKYAPDEVRIQLDTLFPNTTGSNVVSDHPEVATGLVLTSSSTLYITPHGPGAATFTITPISGPDLTPKQLTVTLVDPGADQKVDISDIGKLISAYPAAVQSETDIERMLHLIDAARVNGRPAAVEGGIEALTLQVEQTDFIPGEVLRSYFTDPEGDELTFSVESSNSDVVTAVWTDGGIGIEGRHSGTALITIQAADPSGGTAAAAIPITVLAPPDINHAPQLSDAVTSYVLDPQEKLSIAMDKLFQDPDGDTLTYQYTRTFLNPNDEGPLSLSAAGAEPPSMHASVSESVYEPVMRSLNVPATNNEEPSDYGVVVTRIDNRLEIESRDPYYFAPTTIEVTATDAHFPNEPVTRTVHIFPGSFFYGDRLQDRTLFNHARMEIDLHQKFYYDDNVSGATYHYYLETEGSTAAEGLYSNAHIEGNKLIIEGTEASGYGDGERANADHYKVIGRFDDGEEDAWEMVDGFDLRVEDLASTGYGLYLGSHLTSSESIGDYTVSGRFFYDPGYAVSGSMLGIGWTYGTYGRVTVRAYEEYDGRDRERERDTDSPAVTYKIRFFPHVPQL